MSSSSWPFTDDGQPDMTIGERIRIARTARRIDVERRQFLTATAAVGLAALARPTPRPSPGE